MFTNTGTLIVILLVFMILLFPNGRLLPGPRWRWAAWVLFVDACELVASSTIGLAPIQLSPRLPGVPTPLAVPALDGLTNSNSPLALVSVISLLCILVAGVVVRFRRSRGAERRQLRWFAYVAAAAVGLLLLSLPLGAVNPDLGNVAGLGFGVGLNVLLPATIGLAIMRHGLYDIDVFISRSIVYGSRPSSSLRCMSGSRWASARWSAVAASPTWGWRSWPQRSLRWGFSRLASGCNE